MPETMDQSTIAAPKTHFLSGLAPSGKNGKATHSPSRQKALEALNHLSLPTRKTEAWKYVDLRGFANRGYQADAQPFSGGVTPFLIPGFEARLLVFANGIYRADLSEPGAPEEGVTVVPLSQATGDALDLVQTHLGTFAKPDADIFTAFNTAYAYEGVLIEVKKGKSPLPVFILHVSDVAQPTGFQHRNLLLVRQAADLRVVEAFHTAGTGHTFRNAVTEIVLERDARLEYVKLQLENDLSAMVDTTEVHQATGSNASVFTYTFSGELVRNNALIRLNEPHCEGHLYAAYLLNGTQQVDHHTEMHHVAPHCESNELYKGIVDNQASGSFNGQIHVYPDAQKTNAYQSSRGILLSPDAVINTKPQLEIYADDVKCSHGAATGRIDEDALFYLRARGIPEKEARLMLVHAFAMETAETLSMEAVKDYISNLVDTRF
jgi:Fe-S cluster assembly protein SufD